MQSYVKLYQTLLVLKMKTGIKMSYFKFYVLALFGVYCQNGISQQSVGLISYDLERAFFGYTLIYPHNQSNVYLLNNCGQIVHVWEDTIYFPGNTAYLSENGLLYKTISRNAESNDFIHAPGAGEGIEIRSWQNELIWRWFYNDSTARLHHAIKVMPNGNILAIAWERKSGDEAIQNGRDPQLLTENDLWPDHVIEIEPIGPDSANIVWKWHAWDHLIQDFDPSKENYGDVNDHPELININYPQSGGANWMHVNAIDYNPTLDQVVLSVPHFNEIWIIDHSTTIAESSAHSGGLGGRGGDLLFRWGNPQAFLSGNEDDQMLFFQHDVHWMRVGLSVTDPDYNKLMLFNNRVSSAHSTVNIIDPIFVTYGWEYQMLGGKFLPENHDWTYQRPDSTQMHSTILSSAQRLPNGNTLICVGRRGYVFEINQDQEVVWEYKVPLVNGNPVTQGTNIPISANLLFAAKRYSSGYPAFEGKDLSPNGYIELNPDTAFCQELTSVKEHLEPPRVQVYPNPVFDSYVTFETTIDSDVNVYNVQGRLVGSWSCKANDPLTISTVAWPAGVYTLSSDYFRERILVGTPPGL